MCTFQRASEQTHVAMTHTSAQLHTAVIEESLHASPLGQSVPLTQALASSSSTVPTGHPHPLRHSKVQTLVGSSQVPMQGTQESTPSKYSSPCTWHSAGMVRMKIDCIIEATLGHILDFHWCHPYKN